MSLTSLCQDLQSRSLDHEQTLISFETGRSLFGHKGTVNQLLRKAHTKRNYLAVVVDTAANNQFKIESNEGLFSKKLENKT